MGAVIHPKLTEEGHPVAIKHPSQPSPPSAWGDPNKAATVTPGGAMPLEICGQAICAWKILPTCVQQWEELGAVRAFDEPEFKPQLGKQNAAGAVILEADGRVWVVSPSNGFGGYKNTFPKGRVDHGFSLRACAVKESFEEAGLKVELTGYLCDAIRHTTVTRYYLARRRGGDPADMGWESQAVHLVPIAALASFVAHPNDQPVIKAIKSVLSAN